jgi:hypothetical protein
MSRVALRRRTKVVVRIPTAMISGTPNDALDNAVAVIAFMGCTGISTP